MTFRIVCTAARLAAGLTLAMAIASCSAKTAPSDLPPLPDVSLQEVLPAVREQLTDALDRVARDPLDPAINGQLGMALAANRQSTAAATCFERARALDPEDYRWAYLHGLVLEELGDPEAAAAAIANAVYLNERYVPARVKLATLKLGDGDAAGSAALLGSLLISHEQRADVHFAAGRTQEALGNLDGAQRHFARALELNGPFGAAHYALAGIYRKQDRPEDAAAQLALYEQHRDDKLRIADPVRAVRDSKAAGDGKHIARAKTLVGDGDYEGAAEALAKAIKINPERENSVATLILIQRRLGRLKEAEQVYSDAMERGVSGIGMHFNMANFYLDRLRAADAKNAFARVLKLNPQHADSLAQVGYIAERSAEPSRAAELYRRALQAQPGHKQAGYGLGRLLALNGDYAGGIAQIEAVLEPIDANTPSFLHTLAGIYAKTGDLDKGIELLEDASRLLESGGDAGTTALRNRIETDRRKFVELKESGVGSR